MSVAPGKIVLSKAETLQFRRSQSVSAVLAKAILQVCEMNEAIRICYLLDTRREERGEVTLTIALLLDDEKLQMDSIVIQLQEMLRKFPAVAQTTTIMSAEPFERDYAGAEFYTRRSASFRRMLRKFSMRSKRTPGANQGASHTT
jgi:hypothetical protein